ncbi:MAG TPA: ChaN family lipoprotein [Bacteroidales bacterium]|jgi:uncharacterized iron-regulated protein|nr:ChaN family lipoprotein [Bacteroidales bacterium]HOL97202.1 ChaN family lipoprotein [Bacteroidales bacterium]HOM35494.1 ChaN family lipoprotein [Bacteroidales bacterium]HPD24267.1 ChaN family lipoprotein [Bacteroidales bacterium]HRS98658.1 ChaN family lipoprotein [Bacteroidales bacterium]
MKKFLVLICLFTILENTYSQKIAAFSIYNSKGKKVSVKAMFKNLEKSEIILFGELHNNPISHWLQLELITHLYIKNHNLILGAEMFEADNQDGITAYLKNEIDRKTFDTIVRLWSNYKTDYAPLVEFAKDNNIDFVATNVPRKYASMVNRNGFEVLENLTEAEKKHIAPLPIDYDPELPGYKKMFNMIPGHNSPNLPKAQALKDATMAYFILKNYKTNYIFVHFNGAYHSDNYEGILWYLKRIKPNLKYATISTVTQKDVSKLEEQYKGRADFIICVNENMTTTY